MKRLSLEQKQRNILHARNEEIRHKKSKHRKKNKLLKKQKNTQTEVYEKVLVPENFNLEKQLNEALEMIVGLRKTILFENKLGLIDFSKCKSISAGAGLILAAEVHRCRNLKQRNGKPSLTGTYPQDVDMCLFLDSLGFFKLLKIQSPSPGNLKTIGKRHIEIRTGCRDRGQPMYEIAEVTNKHSVRFDDETREVLYEALVEAMNNVTAHAYPPMVEGNLLPRLNGQWWAAGYWDEENKGIGVMIYDHGVGIPKTLQDNKNKNIVTQILHQLGLGDSDPEHIKAAMEFGSSRFKDENRGKGMEALRQAVEIVQDGKLLILSGKGGYIKETCGEEQIFDLPLSIGGTYIEWQIRDEKLIKWETTKEHND